MTYVIYARSRLPQDLYVRQHVVVFSQAHQAKVWLDRMIGTANYHRYLETEIHIGAPTSPTKPRIFLSCEKLEEVLAAEETDWELPPEYKQWILQFKYGTWETVAAREDEPSIAAIEKSPPRRDTQRRAQRPPGYVTITELCAASGMPAMIARAALRASDRVKPEYGWCFAPDEIDAIKKLCGIKERREGPR